MADITLSSAVRNNLLSLQSTSTLLESTQNNLATGLRVNSALDDPSAFFTASSLNSRAGDLNRLLDSVGLAIQTVEAADDGIGAITDLVEAAQASARSALQASGPTDTAGTVTGTAPTLNAGVATQGGFTEDTAAAVGGSGLTAAGATNLLDASTGITDQETLTIAVDATTTTFTFGTATGESDTLAELVAAINDPTNGAAGVTASIDSGQLVLTADDTDTDFEVGGTANINNAFGIVEQEYTSENLLSQNPDLDGQTLTIQVGNNAATTVTFGDAQGEASTIAELQTLLDNNVAGAATVSVSDTGGLTILAANEEDSIVIGGDSDATIFGFATDDPTITQADGDLISNQIASQGDTFTVAVDGDTTTLTFGTGEGEINSLAELDAQIDAIDGVSATVTDGVLTITNTDATVAATLANGTGTPLDALGIQVGSIANTPEGTVNGTRTAAENEFNNLLDQIDQLAADASFNGNNLLAGDNLTVIFNEDGSSSLSVSGVNFDAEGLGISEVEADAFQDDDAINATLDTLDEAISSLRTQASTFGSNLSVVEIRQDFTKNLINTLETGAAGLTLADSNKEAANLLALQTRQSLSSSSLSLASQADQNVLQLLR